MLMLSFSSKLSRGLGDGDEGVCGLFEVQYGADSGLSFCYLIKDLKS